MIFSGNRLKFAKEYYESLGSVYINLTNQIEESEELKFLFDNESFSNEFLFILLFLSTEIIPYKIQNPKYSKSILDEIHNLYYENLRSKLKMKNEDINSVNILLNKRYLDYRKEYNSENIFFNISKLFLQNIKNDSHLNNISIILSISFWLTKAYETLNNITEKLNKNYFTG